MKRLKAVDDAKEPLIALEEAIHALQAQPDAESEAEEEEEDEDEGEEKEGKKGKEEVKGGDGHGTEGKTSAATATTSSASGGSSSGGGGEVADDGQESRRPGEEARGNEPVKASGNGGGLDDELTEEEGVEKEAAAAAAKHREAGSGTGAAAGAGADVPEDEEDVVQGQGDQAATVHAHSWQPARCVLQGARSREGWHPSPGALASMPGAAGAGAGLTGVACARSQRQSVGHCQEPHLVGNGAAARTVGRGCSWRRNDCCGVAGDACAVRAGRILWRGAGGPQGQGRAAGSAPSDAPGYRAAAGAAATGSG